LGARSLRPSKLCHGIPLMHAPLRRNDLRRVRVAVFVFQRPSLPLLLAQVPRQQAVYGLGRSSTRLRARAPVRRQPRPRVQIPQTQRRQQRQQNRCQTAGPHRTPTVGVLAAHHRPPRRQGSNSTARRGQTGQGPCGREGAEQSGMGGWVGEASRSDSARTALECSAAMPTVVAGNDQMAIAAIADGFTECLPRCLNCSSRRLVLQ
jgi:hypothetical protein